MNGQEGLVSKILYFLDKNCVPLSSDEEEE